MFHKILVANRGEIACRVMHTAKRLGIKTVAIYSEADAHAPHVKLADEAYFIGPPPASESYLRADKIIEITQKSGAEAIHPGYGFLSENATFAKACIEKGIQFIGPSIDAIKIMGSKSESKKLMENVGVPITPGYHGDDQSLVTLTKEADRIGFPLIIKASAGGGGKGMRIVHEASQFKQNLESAQREVKASFNDARILLEKFIENPRHIEVQVFGDTHGNLVHLFERDCSIQRRYQKVVEEAPGPSLSDSARDNLYNSAINAARSVKYIGAGTVEFLMDKDEKIYFMEMNTRLQVEHPVTEMITNQDLVEWQLLVAHGEKLPLSQDQIVQHGHALEVRLCAENPSNDFLPTTGTLSKFKHPKSLTNVRYEAGVEKGSNLSVHYDSMIAKVVAWGETRPKAIQRLEKALSSLKISGVHTNKSYLSAILKHDVFTFQKATTQFIDHYHQGLLKADQPPLVVILLTGLTNYYLDSKTYKNIFTHENLFWRMNTSFQDTLSFSYGSEPHEVSLRIEGSRFTASYKGTDYEGRIHQSRTKLVVEILDERLEVMASCEGCHLSIDYHDETYTFELYKPGDVSGALSESEGHLTAPMPGKIIAVNVKSGDTVTTGDPLVVLEAMKMEHNIKAPFDGIVEKVPFEVGSLVEEGVELVSLSADVKEA